MTRNEREQFAQAADEIRRRDANRAACPVAATLFDTLIEAQCANKGDQGVVSSYIIQVGGRVDGREEVSAADAEKCLRACGLWPEALVTDKIEVADFGTMRAVQFGGVWRWVSDFGPVAAPEPTHLVIIQGREVARFAAKNDHHARNKALKLFGPEARTVAVPPDPNVTLDPFARIR